MSGNKVSWSRRVAFSLAAGILVASFFVRFEGLSLSGHITLAIFLVAATFWMLEPVPIYATSLLVIFLQILLLSVQGPLYQTGRFDLQPIEYTAFLHTLAHPIIILFLGGFILASAAVKYQLDRTLTRLVMKPFGTRPTFILLGLMLVTALLSGFMSNTATTAMMMTVILPVVAVLLWLTEALHGISSTVVAFLPVTLLALLQVVDKNDIRHLPWEVLWLVAGGIALGVAMQQTGMAAWVVALVRWEFLSPFVLLLIFGAITLVLANFLSHTVTATLIVPIAIGLGLSGDLLEQGFNPVIAGLLIAVSASLGMVLPISTPPNAIAISTGLVRTADMARTGVIIGLVGLAGALACAVFFWPLFFG